MTDQWVILGEFVDAAQAHLVKARLESAGIEAVIEDENQATWRPQYGGIKLRVRRADLPDIEAVLADVADETSDDETSDDQRSGDGTPDDASPDDDGLLGHRIVDASANGPLIVVASFPDEFRAHIALSRLQAAGIEGRVIGGQVAYARGLMRHPGVAVPQSEAERAREVLLLDDTPPAEPPPAPPACPACGSGEVRATRFVHPIQWVGLVVLLAALVAANVFGDVPWGVVIVWLLFIAVAAGLFLPRAFVCRQCAHRWREENKDEA